MMIKPIPKPEDVSSEYARLTSLHAKLMARGALIDAEIATLHAQMGAEPAANERATRVESLLAGVDFTPALPIRERLSALASERADIDAAVRELSGQITLERERTSRKIVETFEAERAAMAKRFFKAVAEAAAVHAEYDEQVIRFHRAGVSPAGFTDFGREVFDQAGYRNSSVGIALRDAVRRGYLKPSELPEFCR